MAKKYESEIDPDEFIRSFREEPSALSTFKRESADKNPILNLQLILEKNNPMLSRILLPHQMTQLKITGKNLSLIKHICVLVNDL